MALVKTSTALIAGLRGRLLVVFLSVLALLFLLPWARTDSERIALQKGYSYGLLERLSDGILWKRALLGASGFTLLSVLFMIVAYYFSLWAQPDTNKRP
jgi:lipopolysaccharide export LptBFGC system permease protein LptF